MRLGRSSSTGKVGRAAKPGEVVDRKATPVTRTDPTKTPAKSSPRKQGSCPP